MKYYLNYFKSFKLKIIIYFTLTFFIWGNSLIQPVLSSMFIDTLVQHKGLDATKVIILWMIILGLFNVIIGYILGVLETYLTNKISYECIGDTVLHFQHIQLSKLSKFDSVYITQRIKNDVATIINFLLKEVITIIMNVFCLITSLFLLIKISRNFVYLILIFIPLYLLLYITLKKPLYENGYNAKNSTDEFIKSLTHQISMTKLVKIHSSFNKSRSEIYNYFSKMFKKVLKYSKISYFFSSLDNIITLLFQATVFMVFTKKVYSNSITIGNFILINTYFGFIINSIKYFMSLIKTYQDVKVCIGRLNELNIMNEELNGDAKLDAIESIHIKNISFSYDFDRKDKNFILNNINFIFNKNFIYIIRGKNGGGKSTLFDIIVGLYQQELLSGSIQFNNIDITNLDMYWIRKKHIGLISQKIYYNMETVFEFLLYDYTDNYISLSNSNNKLLYDKLISSIYDYNLNKFFINDYFNIIDLFNKKMNELSGGQRQKVLILREILSDPNVILLDEPTSSLDQRSIDDLKLLINSLKKDKIILINSHDNYFDEIADYEIALGDYND